MPTMHQTVSPKPRRIKPGLSWEAWVPASTNCPSRLAPVLSLFALVNPDLLVLRETYQQLNTRSLLCEIRTSRGRTVAKRRIELDRTSATRSQATVLRRSVTPA